MEKKVQELQAVVAGLKVRVFDAEEALGAERKGINEFLQGLVNVMGVTGDENGNVTLESIARRAQELTALAYPAPVEETHDVQPAEEN